MGQIAPKTSSANDFMVVNQNNILEIVSCLYIQSQLLWSKLNIFFISNSEYLCEINLKYLIRVKLTKLCGYLKFCRIHLKMVF